MADIVSAEERSRNMAAIRNRDTKPEVYLRKLLFARGYRYRIADRSVPGHPDIFLRRSGTGTESASMRTHPNLVLSFGRRNLMIMSDGTELSKKNYWQRISNVWLCGSVR